MKTTFLALALVFLLVGVANAVIVERVIYAGDTPLTSNCTVTQTGPMELAVSSCSWTTTGQSKVVAREKVPNLANEIAADRVVMMPDGKRVRGWLKDKGGNIIERSRTRVLAPTVLNIIAGEEWVVYMVDGPGVTMNLILQPWDVKSPGGLIDYLIMPFKVPLGTTDLSVINIEVFTVRPDFPPAKGLFEK